MRELEVLNRAKDSLEVALLVSEYRRRQPLLDKRDIVEEDSVSRRDVPCLEQSLLAFAQLSGLEVGARKVHEHLRVVMLEELLEAILILMNGETKLRYTTKFHI